MLTLCANDLVDGVVDAHFQRTFVDRLAAFSAFEECEQIGRPREAPDVRSEYSVRAPLHRGHVIAELVTA
jgi:hypothetical protein